MQGETLCQEIIKSIDFTDSILDYDYRNMWFCIDWLKCSQ